MWGSAGWSRAESSKHRISRQVDTSSTEYQINHTKSFCIRLYLSNQSPMPRNDKVATKEDMAGAIYAAMMPNRKWIINKIRNQIAIQATINCWLNKSWDVLQSIVDDFKEEVWAHIGLHIWYVMKWMDTNIKNDEDIDRAYDNIFSSRPDETAIMPIKDISPTRDKVISQLFILVHAEDGNR